MIHSMYHIAEPAPPEGGGPDVIYASQSLSTYPSSLAHHLQMDTSFSDAILSWSYFSPQIRHLNILHSFLSCISEMVSVVYLLIYTHITPATIRTVAATFVLMAQH